MSESHAMVMAIGDSGRPELCREAETVVIAAAPLAHGNRIMPATLRWFAQVRGRDPAATKLLRVHKPNLKHDRPFVAVDIEVAPFVRFTTDSGDVMGTFQSCYVRDLNDALDPIFEKLSVNERERIFTAVRRADAARGAP